jgi:hypothetical protein
MGQIREAEIMDVEQDIRAVLDALERAYFDGTDPCTILGLMYEDDVIVVGEGDVSATRGIQGLEEQARAISASAGPHPQVSFTIVSPILACADAAMTMIGVVVRPDLPDAGAMHSRILAGWRKGPHGWRICMEMHAQGQL